MVYRLRDIKKEFCQPDGRFVLCVPELQLEAGRLCVFQGPSGCGKSTLFDMLGLIAPPTSAGEFQIRSADGDWNDMLTCSESVKSHARSALIGYVLQFGGLLPSLTIAENIGLPLRLRGLPAPRARINDLAGRLGIREQLDKKPAYLSGGQKQRAAIARALVHRPQIVLADEPTGSVDRCTAEEIRDLLVSCAAEEGAAVLVVTHDERLFASQAFNSFTFTLARQAGDVQSTLTSLRT